MHAAPPIGGAVCFSEVWVADRTYRALGDRMAGTAFAG